MILLLSSHNASALTENIRGIPDRKASCDASGCTHETLNADQQKEYEILISGDGYDYKWLTRENKRLVVATSGLFLLLVNPEGSGYVKIHRSPVKCEYMEHITLYLNNITYWGECF